MFILYTIRKKLNNKAETFLILFWIIIILGIIILGLSYRASHESYMVSDTWERSKAYFLTWTGMQEVMKVLYEDDISVDSWHDEWNLSGIRGENENGTWEVKVLYDTDRYVNINTSSEEILYRIFYHIDPVLYYSLLDWRDTDNIPRVDPNTSQVLGAENDYYLQNFGYECRNGALRNLFELGMMKRNVDLFVKSNSFSFVKNEFFAESNKKVINIDRFLSILGIGKGLVYAGNGEGTEPPPDNGDDSFDPPPPPPPPPPPHSPPVPPEAWPPFDPGPPPAPYGPGRSVTVYSDGRVNINTAYPWTMSALGLNLYAISRIFWYKLDGNVFPAADADTIISELVRTGWLFPETPNNSAEVLYGIITSSIKKVAPLLKVNSSYFFVYITSDTGKAVYGGMAVIERYKSQAGKVKCRIISWWE